MVVAACYSCGVSSASSADQVLQRVRRICTNFPDFKETITFSHPTLQVRGKTFAVLEEYKGDLSLCIKVEKVVQDIFLSDARFYRTPYIGQHGWVSLKIHAAPPDWHEITELLTGSYQLVAQRPKMRALR